VRATGWDNGRDSWKSSVAAADTFRGNHDSTEGGPHSAVEKSIGPERSSLALRSNQIERRECQP